MAYRVSLLLLLIPGLAFAQRQPGENVTYGYAQVLHATPAYEMVRARVPEQRCDGAPVDGSRIGAGAVVGAVIGGSLGNQAGKGNGRKGATLAGAVLGGAIGQRIDRNNAANSGRCRTVTVDRDERRLLGYDVEYQYKGEKYMSRLDADPGNRVRIRVSVTPDEQGGAVR
ncbi:MAG: glycine zipper 2TM domain-containing protein [Arenimonas sp.]